MGKTYRYVAKDSGDRSARAERSARKQRKRSAIRADRHNTKTTLRSYK